MHINEFGTLCARAPEKRSCVPPGVAVQVTAESVEPNLSATPRERAQVSCWRRVYTCGVEKRCPLLAELGFYARMRIFFFFFQKTVIYPITHTLRVFCFVFLNKDAPKTTTANNIKQQQQSSFAHVKVPRPCLRSLRFLRPKMRTLEKMSTRLPLHSPLFLLGLFLRRLVAGRSKCCSRACLFCRMSPLAMAAAMAPNLVTRRSGAGVPSARRAQTAQSSRLWMSSPPPTKPGSQSHGGGGGGG